MPPRPVRARPDLGGGHPADAEGRPGRRDRRAGAGTADGPAAQAPGASARSGGAADLVAALPEAAFRTLTWRRGTKGALRAAFAAVRVRVADGPVAARGQHLPGEAAWLVCERRRGGEHKYYLTNHPDGTPLEAVAALIKARWVCEQAHQQLKGELGLDHFEGRGWSGLHHHALLCLIALAFLQHLRLGGGNHGRWPGAAAGAVPAAGAAPPRRGPELLPASLPPSPAAHPLSPAPLNRAVSC